MKYELYFWNSILLLMPIVRIIIWRRAYIGKLHVLQSESYNAIIFVHSEILFESKLLWYLCILPKYLILIWKSKLQHFIQFYKKKYFSSKKYIEPFFLYRATIEWNFASINASKCFIYEIRTKIGSLTIIFAVNYKFTDPTWKLQLVLL